MDSVISIPKSGWTQIETIASYDYGALTGRINQLLGIAFIRWAGNDNLPDVESLSITIPDKYKPLAHAFVVGLSSNISSDRTSIGQMEVRTNGVCSILFPAPNVKWTGAYATYPIA